MKIKKFEFDFTEKLYLNSTFDKVKKVHKINGFEISFKSFEIRFSNHPYLAKQKFYNVFKSYNEHRKRHQFCFFKRWSVAISIPLKLKEYECY